MEEESHAQSLLIHEAQRTRIIGGLPVLRDLEGSLCTHCGSPRYNLVFRLSHDGRNGVLAGRCTRCRNFRELAAEEIERGCVA